MDDPAKPLNPREPFGWIRTQPREMDASDLEGELERLHPASFSWALGCCGRSREEAEEVLQTSYLKIFEGKARFDGQSSFKTFLFGVIRRTASESRRRRLFRGWKLSDPALRRDDTEQSANPEEAASLSEQASRLRKALTKLARRQREVLELVFGQELTVEEAASVLGISTGSARAHYDRAKKRLVQKLGETP